MFHATRRALLSTAGLGGLFGLLPWSSQARAASKARSLYRDLGIRPLINLRGTHTTIGASKMWPELHDAMAEASQQYIVLEELQQAVGERLSKLIGSEAALVTTGAAGAIAIGTCACLTGDSVPKVRQLPDLAGMKSEVIIQKVHRNGYDHAVRQAGVRIVEVESAEQFRNAINEKTAMMYFLGGTSHDYDTVTPVSLEESLRIAHQAGFPVMVDAANMLPPWENLRMLARMGVDLICISGGKHMRGPQCSGILAGRKDLIHAAWLNSNPHSDSQGRPMKAGREEIVGVWLAAEKYAKLDFDALDRECAAQADHLMKALGKIKGVRTEKARFDRTRRVHRVMVTWDEGEKGISGQEMERQLMEGEPRIAVARMKSGIELTVFMNDPGDEKVAARRIREVFEGARKA